ncbi:MAG: WG repeat-containing protein [Elusimicrobia bacterium]|nr:WG repeat-containing protein [Elusimicrobiota bacterium]
MNGRFGFVDADGELAIPLKFYYAEEFSEGLAAVWFPPKPFQERGSAVEELAAAGRTVPGGMLSDYRRTGASEPYPKWIGGADCGYVDFAGRTVVQPGRFRMCGRFQEGLARVWREDGAFEGYIDRSGALVIGRTGAYPGFDFSDGLAAQNSGKWYFIGKDGQRAFKYEYDWVTSYHNGVALAANGSPPKMRWLAIDASGKTLKKLSASLLIPWHALAGHIPFEGGFERELSSGLVPECRELGEVAQFRYFDREGTPMPGALNGKRPYFTHAEPFSEGLAAVAYFEGCERIHALIQPTGVPAVRLPSSIHVDGLRFSEGLAAVSFGGSLENGEWRGAKWGYIDTSGKVTIDPRFDQAGPFSRGAAFVVQGRHSGYIDKRGELIWSDGPLVTKTQD